MCCIIYCTNPVFSPYIYVCFELLEYDAIHHDHIQYDADVLHHADDDVLYHVLHLVYRCTRRTYIFTNIYVHIKITHMYTYKDHTYKDHI